VRGATRSGTGATGVGAGNQLLSPPPDE